MVEIVDVVLGLGSGSMVECWLKPSGLTKSQQHKGFVLLVPLVL